MQETLAQYLQCLKKAPHKKELGSGIGMAPLNHFKLATAVSVVMTMASSLVKGANFATLKQEGNESKRKVNKMKKELKHARKHGKSKKREREREILQLLS